MGGEVVCLHLVPLVSKYAMQGPEYMEYPLADEYAIQKEKITLDA